MDGITGGSWIVPAYDEAGNMLSGPSPLDPTVRHHYKWDAWNRLVAVYADDNNEPGDLIAEYRYDAFNRRIAKLIPNGNNWDRTDYYYAGARVVEERFAANQANKETLAVPRKFQYVWDIRYIHAAVLRDEDTDADNDCTDSGGSERLYYTQDANFNVTALVGTDGSVAERYVYDPYGKRTIMEPDWSDPVDWEDSKKNEILYTGHRLNPESGLYYCGARYYDPVLGRWISWDWIVYADGMSLYEYVGSEPNGYLDPTGFAKNWPRPDRSAEGAFWRREQWDAPRGSPKKYYEKVTLKECNVVILIAHQNVVHWQGFHFDHVEELAAAGYLTCWGRLYNWSRDESPGLGSVDEPAPGSIENFPDIKGVVGKGKYPELKDATPQGFSKAEEEMYGVGKTSSDAMWNAGQGGGLAGWSALYHQAVDAAKAQAKKFAADCKCKCDYIDVWVITKDELGFTGGHYGRGVIEAVKCQKNLKSGQEPAETAEEHVRGLREATKNDPTVGGPWKPNPPLLAQ